MPYSLRGFLCSACIFLALAWSTRGATVNATWNSATDVPVTASSYTATGNTVNFTLNFAPATGTNLTVVNNTGLSFISGVFSNLAQGQQVNLSYSGTTYSFVAHYYGGSGNDLVLVWANNCAVAWGTNTSGQVGDGSTTNRTSPVPVFNSGGLAGKTVVSISTGTSHSLALCGDGTLFGWGGNTYGSLGNGSDVQTNVPLPVNTANGTSALYGKTVVAIATGGFHSLALCSDGTVAAWGYNLNGQLGINSSITESNVPVAVNTTSGISALYGKSVVAIGAGNAFSVALCSDGTVVTWGYNFTGELGNNTTTDRKVPVAVNTASGVSALYGKTVVAIAAGSYHVCALCSDGTLVAWGLSSLGEMGNNTSPYTNLVPVQVSAASGVSALYGKTVASISAGEYHCMALCTDGTLTTWGGNDKGQLGTNTQTQSLVPTLVSTASGISYLYGKTVTSISSGLTHSLAVCSDGTAASWGDMTLAPVAVSNAALPTGAQLIRGACSIDNYGFGYTCLAIAALPVSAIVSTQSATSVIDASAVLNGTVNANGVPATVSFDYGGTTAYGSNVAATPSTISSNVGTAVSATLTGLALGATYHFRVIATNSNGTFYGNDQSFTTAPGALVATFNAATDVAVVTDHFTATGDAVNFTLNFVPVTGTTLTVVKNTGLGFINGTFSNLAQGQLVNLSYNGVGYKFVANYYGGTGNDLVLVWAGTRPVAWGSGGLGNNSVAGSSTPVNLTTAGTPLASRILLAASAGRDHSLAVCSDGSIASWGGNSSGQLGNRTTTDSTVPVAVTTAGTVLSGKTVIAVSAGYQGSLALCSDGSLAAWGYNSDGELGNTTTASSNLPVAVTTAGTPLAGKVVVAISSGFYHRLALCSDGTLAAWGYNADGELGNNTTASSNLPVAVSTAGTPLAGKTVVAISAGNYHNIALCSDGTLVTWGLNNCGQLGNNSITNSSVPVAVATSGTALAGKTVIAVSAGDLHSMVLCSDGTLVTWGNNADGELGNNTTANSSVPVVVTTAGTILAGKTVVAAAAGDFHNLALCADGTLAAWGGDIHGELGNNSTTSSRIPVAVSSSSLAAGETFVLAASGPGAITALVSLQRPHLPSQLLKLPLPSPLPVWC